MISSLPIWVPISRGRRTIATKPKTWRMDWHLIPVEFRRWDVAKSGSPDSCTAPAELEVGRDRGSCSADWTMFSPPIFGHECTYAVLAPGGYGVARRTIGPGRVMLWIATALAVLAEIGAIGMAALGSARRGASNSPSSETYIVTSVCLMAGAIVLVTITVLLFIAQDRDVIANPRPDE